MPPILIAIGDTHGHFDVLEDILSTERKSNPAIAAVLHCGDLGLYDANLLDRLPQKERYLIQKHGNPVDGFRPYLRGEKILPLPVYAIKGNHEDFDLVRELEEGRKTVPNLYLLRPGEVASVQGTGYTVMGIGGILPLGLAHRNTRRGKYTQPEEIAATLAAAGAAPTFLLLHETPLLRLTPGHTYGHPKITEVVRALKPRAALAGHIHREYRLRLDGIPVSGLGYGGQGRYALVDDRLEVTFKDLSGREVVESPATPREDVPPELIPPLPPAPRAERFLTKKEIFRVFGLDPVTPEINLVVNTLSQDLWERQKSGEIHSREEARKVAERLLRDKGIL